MSDTQITLMSCYTSAVGSLSVKRKTFLLKSAIQYALTVIIIIAIIVIIQLGNDDVLTH